MYGSEVPPMSIAGSSEPWMTPTDSCSSHINKTIDVKNVLTFFFIFSIKTCFNIFFNSIYVLILRKTFILLTWSKEP